MLSREEKEKIANIYYGNNCLKMRKEAIKAYNHIGCKEDLEEFIDLANYIFVKDVLETFDEELDEKLDKFNGYLFTCLTRKFKSEMTRLNRYKRQADKFTTSLELEDDSGVPFGSKLAAKGNFVDKIIGTDIKNKKISIYINNLSRKQQQVAMLIMDGYDNEEIQSRLGIKEDKLNALLSSMKSFENIKVLF